MHAMTGRVAAVQGSGARGGARCRASCLPATAGAESSALSSPRPACNRPPPRCSGPADPWPGGGNTVFSPNFKCTGKPGNPDMLLIPPPPARGASANSANSGSSSLSAGAIAGIVVGSVAAAALLAGAAALLVARRRKQRGTADGAGAKGSGGSLAPSSDIEKGGPGSNKDSASASYDARGSGGSGSLPSAAARSSDVGAADTDTAKLPAEWNVIPFADLELASTLGRGSFGAVSAARWCKTTGVCVGWPLCVSLQWGAPGSAAGGGRQRMPGPGSGSLLTTACLAAVQSPHPQWRSRCWAAARRPPPATTPTRATSRSSSKRVRRASPAWSACAGAAAPGCSHMQAAPVCGLSCA